jgi:hypothetical protein
MIQLTLKRLVLCTALLCTSVVAQVDQEASRQEAIAEFTKKQQAANWPEKFARIGQEMGVPSDVLAAVAFTETRWEHLKWPDGETVSPETGRPRGYGIMFLQDNDHFGHSLIEAANLIGKTPQELKDDPELNIRGAAALLKKFYDENPKPDFAKPEQIESWYNAIIKYCGIPQPYLSHSHALNCYVYMNKGYNQYGMYWTPHPVDVKPMQEDVAKLRKEFDEAIRQREANKVATDTIEPATNAIVQSAPKKNIEAKPRPMTAEVQEVQAPSGFNFWPWLAAGFFVCVVTTIMLARLKKRR